VVRRSVSDLEEVKQMSLQAVPAVRPIRQPIRCWSDGRDAIRAAVGELHRRHPRAGEQQIARLLTERLETDGDLLEAGAVYLVHDATKTAERRARSAPTLRTAETARRQRAACQVAAKAEAQAVAGKVKEQVLLDTMVTLVTGEQKQLRFCYGRELASLGNAYCRLAAQVPAEVMIGEALVESQVRELLCAP
jgi:hypothetical protein